MPSLQNFAVTAGAAATVTTQVYTIAGQVQDDAGAVILDLTGASSLAFPTCLAGLSQAQRDTVLGLIAPTILEMEAGVFQG